MRYTHQQFYPDQATFHHFWNQGPGYQDRLPPAADSPLIAAKQFGRLAAVLNGFVEPRQQKKFPHRLKTNKR